MINFPKAWYGSTHYKKSVKEKSAWSGIAGKGFKNKSEPELMYRKEGRKAGGRKCIRRGFSVSPKQFN